MTLAFSLRRLLSAFCKNLSRCLKITRGWSHKRGLGNEVLTNFPIVAHPESTLLSSVEDVLLNTHKTDQDPHKVVLKIKTYNLITEQIKFAW